MLKCKVCGGTSSALGIAHKRGCTAATTVVRTGLPSVAWRKLNEGVTPNGFGNTCVEAIEHGNEVLRDLPFVEVPYTQLHERVRLDAKTVRELKRTVPQIFPEYTDLQRALEEFNEARERLHEKQRAWTLLGGR